MTTRPGEMQSGVAPRAGSGSSLVRNLLLVAGYLAILTIIALGYGG